MVDLSAEMADLWSSLAGGHAGTPAPGRGRLVEFIAARNGEGVSTVAREFALYVSRRLRRRVWLIDLDLMDQSQAEAVARNPARYGPIGPATTATPSDAIFFTVQPALKRPDGGLWADARYICAHSVGADGLWVTRFRREAMRPRQGVHVTPTPDYWEIMRRHADLVVVDAPPATRSQAGLTVAPFMDEVVLVLAADETDTRAPARLRDELEGAGANVAGLFVNRVEVEAPTFLRGAAL